MQLVHVLVWCESSTPILQEPSCVADTCNQDRESRWLPSETCSEENQATMQSMAPWWVKPSFQQYTSTMKPAFFFTQPCAAISQGTITKFKTKLQIPASSFKLGLHPTGRRPLAEHNGGMMSIAAWAPSLLLVEQIWEVKCLFPLISEGVADNRPTQDSLPRDTFLQSPQPPKQAMMPPLCHCRPWVSILLPLSDRLPGHTLRWGLAF